MISRKMARIVVVVERPLVGLQDVLEDFLFAGRRKDFRAVVVLDLADLGGEAGPFVDQLQDLQVELVDLGAQALQLSRRLCGWQRRWSDSVLRVMSRVSSRVACRDFHVNLVGVPGRVNQQRTLQIHIQHFRAEFDDWLRLPRHACDCHIGRIAAESDASESHANSANHFDAIASECLSATTCTHRLHRSVASEHEQLASSWHDALLICIAACEHCNDRHNRTRLKLRLAILVTRSHRQQPEQPAQKGARTMAEEKIIGIDLGTTNSVVAVMEGGEVKVIANQEGNRLTPSVVAFTDKGDRLVGDPAKRQAVTNPRRTVYSIKRFMGRRHNEVESRREARPVQDRRRAGRAGQGGHRRQAVHAAGNLGDDPAQAQGGGRGVPGPHASARRSSPCRRTSTTPSGRRPSTPPRSPASTPNGRSKTRRPARRPSSGCGSSTSRPPPSLAYGLDKKKNEKIAVFDLGGGTFDISILDVGDGVFEVKATNGDTHLGGDDFDQVLIDYIADEFKKENGIDLRKDQMALQRLKEAAERAKKDLSQQTHDRHQPAVHHGRRRPGRSTCR